MQHRMYHQWLARAARCDRRGYTRPGCVFAVCRGHVDRGWVMDVNIRRIDGTYIVSPFAD